LTILTIHLSVSEFPRIVFNSFHQVDSKKELEQQLKGVCEAVIMALTKV